MSKKKHDVMAQERKNFIYGVEEDGVVKLTVHCGAAFRRKRRRRFLMK